MPKSGFQIEFSLNCLKIKKTANNILISIKRSLACIYATYHSTIKKASIPEFTIAGQEQFLPSIQYMESIQQSPVEPFTVDSPSMDSLTADQILVSPYAVKQNKNLHLGQKDSASDSSLFGHAPASEPNSEDPFADEMIYPSTMEPMSSPEMKTSMPPPKQFTIQLGDKIFTLHAQTIEKYSKKLSNQFCSRHWKTDLLEKSEQGFYLLEGNGEMFDYLYDYMVFGTFPLFFAITTGFDYKKYASLLEQAQYWGIYGMSDWIKKKRFEGAVKIHVNSHEIADNLPNCILSSNLFHEYHPQIHMRKVYLCPRRIEAHRGRKYMCGRRCENARGEVDEFEKEREWRTVCIQRNVVIDEAVLREEREEL